MLFFCGYTKIWKGWKTLIYIIFQTGESERQFSSEFFRVWLLVSIAFALMYSTKQTNSTASLLKRLKYRGYQILKKKNILEINICQKFSRTYSAKKEVEVLPSWIVQTSHSNKVELALGLVKFELWRKSPILLRTSKTPGSRLYDPHLRVTSFIDGPLRKRSLFFFQRGKYTVS